MTRKIEILDLDDLIRRYEAGESLKHLSDEIGFDRWTIRGKFIQQGIHIRGRSEAERLKWSLLKSDRSAVERQCAAAWMGRRGRKDPLERKIRRARTQFLNATRKG